MLLQHKHAENAGTKLSDKFTGVVCEVVSGDCLVVRDSANGQERRVNLSSIRAPKFGRKGEKPEDWATEAKEFLRQRLISESLPQSYKSLPQMLKSQGGPCMMTDCCGYPAACIHSHNGSLQDD